MADQTVSSIPDKPVADRILDRYPHASPLQRWHMRGRLYLCPYDALLKHLTGAGDLLDIGCGFGHLAWYLAASGSRLRYYGADIDGRKIDLAIRSADPFPLGGGSVSGASRPAFKLGNVLEPADWLARQAWPERFGNIALLDVIYLMPWDLQVRMLDWALERLAPESGSALVIKTMDEARGFPGFRAVAEEWIMVRLLRRTLSSGALNGIRPLSAYLEFARARGFRCEVDHLPTFNPSTILRLHR